ncbi:hypothetical protein MCAP1_002392 [Malassezia caprae]|uniref:Uncharacterized protein n=1 Tax=Malassezia caprae TaxID=1381934 RepID=A0AAF0E9K4_9BASI|nr:hypothetical protein MCAP1_002392 [Malassezia caprae]
MIATRGPSLGDAREPDVDLVIKFEGIPSNFVASKARAPATLLQARATELERLLERLRSVRLQCTTRAGPDGQVLIFVRVNNDALRQARWNERNVCGAGVRIHCSEFPHVIDMMPLHDVRFDRAWIQAWSNVSVTTVLSGISDEDIAHLRDNIGEHIALYFAFLNYYFKALAPAGTLGLIFWACGQPFSAMYSILLVIWATIFLEMWKIRERALAVRWGMTGVSRHATRNISFQPSAVVKDKITGEPTEVFEEWRREMRIIASLPVILIFIVLLLSILTLNFLAEVITAEIYDGPGKAFVPLIPTVLYSTCIPLIMMTWNVTAKLLTKWENHATMRAHNGSLTLKLFGMQSLVTYAGLVLTAYVYIPYGERIILELFRRGYLTEIFRFVSGQEHFLMPRKLKFKISPQRLHSQLFALCVSGQVMNTVSEVLLPIGLRLLTQLHQRWTQRRQTESQPLSSESGVAHQGSEAEFLARVQAEFQLPVYDTFVDYAEMATQLGSIILWSVIWPLAPTIGLINNFFEIRSDTVKLIMNMRRPIPLRAESIGSWLNVMALTLRLAVFTNASLVYLFETHADSESGALETVMRTYAGGKTSTADSIFARITSHFMSPDSAGGTLAAAFLCAVLCDQLFGIVQLFVRYIVKKYMWENSEEDFAIRKVEHMNRVAFVERLQSSDSSATQLQTPYAKHLELTHEFWDASKDNGLSTILGAGKRD